MRFKLIDMHKNAGSTFLCVTHDQVEAMSMGTSIVLMNGRFIEQAGSPQEIYERLASLFAEQFIGSPPTNVIAMDGYFVGIRPRNLRICDAPADALPLPSAILFYEHLGSETIYHLRVGALS